MHALFDLLGAIALGAWGVSLAIVVAVSWALSRDSARRHRRPRILRRRPSPVALHVDAPSDPVAAEQVAAHPATR